MIELEQVTKKYGKFTAVDKLSLKVAAGEVFGFLGPNGAGKTTTIKMITGLLQPTSGRVRVAGHYLDQEPEPAKQRLGFIPDRPFLYGKLTAAEFLHFMGGLWDLDGGEIDRKAGRLFDLFELTGWEDELIESFSHGMRQKLILAGALIHDPDVIVVDEPMVGLDPKSIRLVKDIFRELSRRGRTVFMSTHDLAIAEESCSRVAIIQEGKIIAIGSVEQLREQSRQEGGRLEEIFLRLTHGETLRNIDIWGDGPG
ncbi:MAG TPA: ABC transporter ATP-binding protein [Candidatus Glassbacteria bacterium]|nr:ABC transporter ATP-binding protein [Candidatus Glassbacteria bacterium]